jgi:hypothetical protein
MDSHEDRFPRATRRTFHHFDNPDEAISYRASYGTGGWIFSCGDKGEALLFPLGMTPSSVLSHPYVAGKSGKLL